MDLPHGVLVRSFKGQIPLAEFNAALLKDSFTGFMRASLLEGSFFEGVIVYEAGKPIIAFTSDGKSDRPDIEQKAITSAAANDDVIIELFLLNEGQLRLVMDFCKEFMIPRPPQPPKPAVEAPRPMPVQRAKPRETPANLPEVRGSFVKSETPASLRSYVESRKDETGHAMIVKQDGTGYAEYHLLFLHGKVVAAYSAFSKEAGTALLNATMDLSGVVEFYHVDDALIHSILKMYPHVAAANDASPASMAEAVNEANKEQPAGPAKPEPGPMQVLRPELKPFMPPPVEGGKPESMGGFEAMAHKILGAPETLKPMETHKLDTLPRQGMGVPAKSLFEKNDRQAYDTEGGIGIPAPESKSTGVLKGDMDDDADFVKNVENEFVGNVDDLLKRLELSHLKVVPDKKKRV